MDNVETGSNFYPGFFGGRRRFLCCGWWSLDVEFGVGMSLFEGFLKIYVFGRVIWDEADDAIMRKTVFLRRVKSQILLGQS